jgi:hypothetical protein
MNATTDFPDVETLYVDSVHVQSIEIDWRSAAGEYADGWTAFEAPTCSCGDYARWMNGDDLLALAGIDLDDLRDEAEQARAKADDALDDDSVSGTERQQLDELADGLENRLSDLQTLADHEAFSAWRCPDPDCEHFGEELDPFEYGAEGPMMNYWYPLPKKSYFGGGGYDQKDADKIRHLPLCIVSFEDGGEGLALTGGGMDLSWEIAEAFCRLGHLPPLHFCDLPEMAGMKLTPERKWVLDACRRSCEVVRHQAERAQERLDRLVERLQDGEA